MTALYDVRIRHTRMRPPTRSFEHRRLLWLLDPDAPPRLPVWLRPFARFPPRDHLGDLRGWLRGEGVDLAGGRVLMLAQARSLGFVFNPLTLYWCHDPRGALVCVVAEVHNTYRQRHRYLVPVTPGDREARVGKEFYVSPFLAVRGDYRMSLPVPGQRLAVTVTLHQDGAPALVASMRGERRPATAGELCRLLVRRPLSTHRTWLSIRWHGIALWLRGVPVEPRPGQSTTPTGSPR